MWEFIDDDAAGVDKSNIYSSRLKVINGWLVRTIINSVHGVQVRQTFVKDAGHHWKLENEKKN